MVNAIPLPIALSGVTLSAHVAMEAKSGAESKPNRAGLGASHQTGLTGMVAKLIQQPGRVRHDCENGLTAQTMANEALALQRKYSTSGRTQRRPFTDGEEL